MRHTCPWQPPPPPHVEVHKNVKANSDPLLILIMVLGRDAIARRRSEEVREVWFLQRHASTQRHLLCLHLLLFLLFPPNGFHTPSPARHYRASRWGPPPISPNNPPQLLAPIHLTPPTTLAVIGLVWRRRRCRCSAVCVLEAPAPPPALVPPVVHTVLIMWVHSSTCCCTWDQWRFTLDVVAVNLVRYYRMTLLSNQRAVLLDHNCSSLHFIWNTNSKAITGTGSTHVDFWFWLAWLVSGCHSDVWVSCDVD